MEYRHQCLRLLSRLLISALAVGCAPIPTLRWEIATTSEVHWRVSAVDLTPDGSLRVIDATGMWREVPLADVTEVRWKSNAAIDWGGAVGALLGGLAGCAIGSSDARTNSPDVVDGLSRLLRGTIGGVFVGGVAGGLAGAAIGSDDVCKVDTLSPESRIETVTKFIGRHR